MRFLPTGRMTGSATPRPLMRLPMISIALVSFLLALCSMGRRRGLVDLEREGDATRDRDRAAGGPWTGGGVRQEDVIPLLDVLERLLEADVGEILGEIELPLLADLLEGDEFARRLARLFSARRLRR
jgi:hypothetical protein